MAPIPTLPEALRLAADLIEDLGYGGGITWRGTELHLHNVGAIGLKQLDDAGGTCTEAWVLECNDETECDMTDWLMGTGLRVTCFGPTRTVAVA